MPRLNKPEKIDIATADESAGVYLMSSAWNATLKAVAQQPHSAQTARTAASDAAAGPMSSRASGTPESVIARNGKRCPSNRRPNSQLPSRPEQPNAVSVMVMALASTCAT